MRSVVLVLFLAFFLSGCGPEYTYPADKVPSSIEKICLDEYGIKVNARVVGKTVGALTLVNSSTDLTKQISHDTSEKMGKVLQALTRVALSTELPLDFCVTVLRDRIRKTELVVIRSVDDTKRANAEMIGIEEANSRTVFGQNRYVPAAGGAGSFVLKEIKLEDFLVDQMVQRIRFSFAKDAKDENVQPFVLADGSYEKSGSKKIFQFSVIALKKEETADTLSTAFKVVSQVLGGYRFNDFDEVEIKDYSGRKKLVIPKDALLLYQTKKIKFEEILKRYTSEFDTAQDAFKLFGFSFSANPAEVEPASSIAPE